MNNARLGTLWLRCDIFKADNVIFNWSIKDVASL
jgi:hypothetical protein